MSVTTEDPRPRRRRAAFAVLLVGALAALVAAVSSLPLETLVADLARRLNAFGLAGSLLFFLAFGLLAMVLVPTSVLSFVAGLVYGWPGAASAWATMMAVSTISFVLARTLLAERVATAMDGDRRLRILADFIETQGWRIVLLVRVSGIVPFGVQNYVFGATRMPFRHFFAATTAGVLPSILLAASAGVAGHEALTGSSSPLRLAVIGLSVLVSLVLILLTARELRARFAAAGDAV